MSNFGKMTGVLDIGGEQADNVHGFHKKELIVLHETVSGDVAGWGDILGVSEFLDRKDYGIHAIADFEGRVAVAMGYGTAIFYHTQSGSCMVNSRGIGIELISKVMLQAKDNDARWRIWWERNKQIEATAQLVATYAGKHDIPIQISDGRQGHPGVTTHWQVTKNCGIDGGHVDCWPRHLGGYFPLRRIVARAQYLKARGW